jgi:tRNA 2-thiouridine synthesizing protein E
MPLFARGDVQVEVDAYGFMTQPEAWTDAVARALAADQGLDPLTEAHWAVLRFLRSYWNGHGVVPMIQKLCRATELPLGKLYELFPNGPARGACKIAGLPRPPGCS